MNVENEILIGIDGGASKTRGVIFNGSGKTLACDLSMGSNLSVYGEKAVERIISMIHNLCEKSNILIERINVIGLGIAGASNKDVRDLLFKKLDALNISKNTIISNDAEAAYEINCPGDFGILVTVGTGVICLSKSDEKIFRTAGLGHYEGDKGSGYWIGKQAINNLLLNETSVVGDQDLEQIMKIILDLMNENKFQFALEKIKSSDDHVQIVAKIAYDIINLAQKGNLICLSIIQEAAHHIANYILEITEKLDYTKNNIVVAGNGSIIKNNFFRKLVNEELIFNFPDIKWSFSTISAAYGAALLAAKLIKVNIDIVDIINGDSVVLS